MKRKKALREAGGYLKALAAVILPLCAVALLMLLLDDGKPQTPAGCRDPQYGDCESGVVAPTRDR